MAKPAQEFGDVLRQIIVRVSLPMIVVFVTVLRAIWGPVSAHEIGTHAIVFDHRADNFLTGQTNGGLEEGHRIRVVDFGLEEGRGLAFRPMPAPQRDHIYVADAWDAIFDCQLDRSDGQLRCDNTGEPRARRLPETDVCPFGECVAVEHGGLALRSDGTLYVSDAHQRRVSERTVSSGSQQVRSVGEDIFGHTHDVVLIAPDTLMVAASGVDDGSRTDEGDESKDTPQGHVFELSRAGKRTDINAMFTHPVGLAYSVKSGRLYVADIKDRAETWRYFERVGTTWQEKGILWAQAIADPERWPRLQSMVIGMGPAGTGEVIFAAGPDGLYVFHPDGALLAKYVLGTPVGGLAWGRRTEDGTELFMTVGRRLAVLKTKAVSANPATDSPSVSPSSVAPPPPTPRTPPTAGPPTPPTTPPPASPTTRPATTVPQPPTAPPTAPGPPTTISDPPVKPPGRPTPPGHKPTRLPGECQCSNPTTLTTPETPVAALDDFTPP